MKKKDEEFVASILYKDAVRDENRWRRLSAAKEDVVILDQLLSEVRGLGYEYKYLSDLTNRDNDDPELLKVINKYIGVFKDEGISSELVGVAGKKGNVGATEIILQTYATLSEDAKWRHTLYFDNALGKIKDQRFIADYLKLLESPVNAARFPITSIMLAKWNVDAAKKIFLEHLEKANTSESVDSQSIIHVSIEALSYYPDYDGQILETLKRLSCDKDKTVAKNAQKALSRLIRINSQLRATSSVD